MKQALLCAAVVVVCMLAGNSRAPATDHPQLPSFTSPREWPDDPPLPPATQPPAEQPGQPTSYVRGSFSSVQVNVDAFGNNIFGDAANEPSIGVDPSDPSRIIIGWRQFDTINSNFRQAGWGYSHDGGQTWTFPGVIEPGVFRSDPVLDSDAEGNFYYYSLTVDPGFRCDMFKSLDGGLSWRDAVPAIGGDKNWMAIDKNTTIGRGNVYCDWSFGEFTRSVDGGLTYADPIMDFSIWGTIAVGPEGEVYVAGWIFDGYLILGSTTMRDYTADPEFTIGNFFDFGGPLALNSGMETPNPDGLLGQVWVAVNPAEGPNYGDVYLLSSVDPPGADPQDVRFMRSTDGLLTFSEPVRVNDDPEGNNAWQWFGTMSVAPNGRIDAFWNDTRNSGAVNLSELFYAYSVDGGDTWSENVAVSPMFDSHIGWPNQAKIGDYYHSISDNTTVRLAYSATFNSEQDVYFLQVELPDCNNNGIPDQQDLADGTSPDQDNDGFPDECACAIDAECADGDLCNGMETCNAQTLTCEPGVPVPTADGQQCTVDICDPATGEVDHLAADNGVPCDASTLPGACQSGQCLPCQGNERFKIDAQEAAAGDEFGFFVSISDDVVVSGAPQANGCPAQPDCSSGAAYVHRYDATANVWLQEARLTASDAEPNDFFGGSVAVSGDTIVVGAESDDDACPEDSSCDSGAAYVYAYDAVSGMWDEQMKLTASDAAAGDHFGGAVSISGDIIVVGAEDDDDACPADPDCDSGAAYIFRREGAAWIEDDKLSASDAALGDAFGTAVSISGNAVLIGASRDDDGGSNSGAAYVYRYSAPDWLEEDRLVASDADSSDFFGASVALHDNAAIIGAWRDEEAASVAGSAYIFQFDGSDWNQQDKIFATDADLADRFGWSVSLYGDSALVGAYRDDDAGASSGSAHMFRFDDESGAWREQAKISASDATAGDEFGYGVALGANAAVVGARRQSSAGQFAGAAYIYQSTADCNTNTIVDLCDIVAGASPDDDGNGIPDECENQAPVAQCQDIDVAADQECLGPVSPEDVDAGSFDPDEGDTLTLTLEPAGPYELGATAVLLTVTDDSGASDSCPATVTVLDQSAPEISCPADITITSGESTDPEDTGAASAMDNCDPDAGIGFEDTLLMPACPADAVHFVIERIWSAGDASGNAASCVQEITVLRRPVSMFIKEQACPAPVNPDSNGFVPVLLAGQADFDVQAVVLSSLQLLRADCVGGGAVPNQGPPGPSIGIEDAYHPGGDSEACACDGNNAPDGTSDLSLKFKSADLADALQLDQAVGVVELALTGELDDGSGFIAHDCIVIVPPGSEPENLNVQANIGEAYIELQPLDLYLDDAGLADFWRAYYPGTVIRATAPSAANGRPFLYWIIDGVAQRPGVTTAQATILDQTTLRAVFASQPAADSRTGVDPPQSPGNSY